jgi:predicted enzyme related to lactoylglutathione lyase
VNIANIESNNCELTVRQMIENFREYRGKTVSLSVWIYSTVANKIKIGITDGITGDTFSLYHLGTGWEQLIVSQVIATNATRLMLFVFHINSGDLAVSNYYVDNAMLVVGTEAIDYVPLNPAEDMDRCKRFYQKYTSLQFDQHTGVSVYSPIYSLFLPTKLSDNPVGITVTPSSISYVQGNTLSVSVQDGRWLKITWTATVGNDHTRVTFDLDLEVIY